MSDNSTMTGADGVRCLLFRGGTSKGACFLASDLPADVASRDDLLLRILGSPDPRQIDGVGGGHPLTSKVGIVSPSELADADVDYLFLQVVVDEPIVTDRQNCGNILAAVAPFAIERGLVGASDPTTRVRINMVNTGGVATAVVQTPGGKVRYDGDLAIAGVPGTAAPVVIEFEGTAGSSCGSLLPTGRAVDVFAGVSVTCVDNGMPVVVLDAAAVGARGDETCEELEANLELRAKVEAIRLEAGPAMGLGDVTKLTVPKMTLVSPPTQGGAISTRTFIPHRCHDAIGVLGAVSVATAALLPGTPAHALARIEDASAPIACEHPTGDFGVIVDLDLGIGLAQGSTPIVHRVAVVRTARKLFDGLVFPRV